MLALIVLLLRSRYGLALKAIRDSELAAQCNGVDVLRTKVLVYILTAAGDRDGRRASSFCSGCAFRPTPRSASMTGPRS